VHGYFVRARRWLKRRPRIRCSKEEMFVPITDALVGVRDRAEAIRLANDSRFGLTAGLYGNDDERPISSPH